MNIGAFCAIFAYSTKPNFIVNSYLSKIAFMEPLGGFLIIVLSDATQTSTHVKC